MPKNIFLIALFLLWLPIVSAGFVSLHNYACTPGESPTGGKNWLAGNSIALASPLSTLVMVVHPQCPCSKASISELGIVMAQCRNKLKAYVLFVKPSRFPEGWERSDLWSRTNQIPGVSAVLDKDGLLSKNFNAATSGQCYLYDAHGHLLFSGGITGERGHEGANIGVDAVIALTYGHQTMSRFSPVFGCSLFGKTAPIASSRE